MRFRIRHVTRFTYDQPAYESHNEVRLMPRDNPLQRTLDFRLEVVPRAAVISYRDGFGNLVHALSIHEPHRELLVAADSLVERTLPRPPDVHRCSFRDFLASDAERSCDEYDFLHASRYVPFSAPLKKLFWSVRPRMEELVGDYAERIVSWICDQFAYEPGSTDVHSDVDRILTVGAGVCQDFAHLAIGLLRLAGVPARYVSGYLAPRTRPGETSALGPQLSHAWVELLLPEGGWTGLDPTHGCMVTDHYVRVAMGRDYADVPPLCGVYRSSGDRQHLQVSVDIGEAEQSTERGSGTGQQ
jgi:transglutaminase-like putative cysteine protease